MSENMEKKIDNVTDMLIFISQGDDQTRQGHVVQREAAAAAAAPGHARLVVQ